MLDLPVEIHRQEGHRACICRAVLLRLPDWFGRQDAIDAYAGKVRSLPMLVALAGRRIAGFLSWDHTTGEHAEIVAMAVRFEWHRQGIGRQLLNAAVSQAGMETARRLFVRTLGPSHSDPYYKRTRAFYRACGFRPVSESLDYWGPGTPSLLLVTDLTTVQPYPRI